MLIKGITQGEKRKMTDYVVFNWDADYPKDQFRREQIRDMVGNFIQKLCNNGPVSVWMGDECPYCMNPMEGKKCKNPKCHM